MKRKVNDLFKDIYIPKNSIILLHVRLKNLFDIKYDYADLSRSIYDAIENKFSPVEILVPSYTYSFTKSRIFDYRKSKSEVGRFSEEIRILNDPNKRTKDPVFSIISTKNFFIKQNLDNSSAFGSNSTWDILGKLGHYTININLTEPIVTTYLHKLEFDYKSPYRFMKIFSGKIIDSNNNITTINYRYYVRNLDEDIKWDRKKILKYLESKSSILKSKNQKTIAFYSKSIDKHIGQQLSINNNFLI